MLIIRIMFYIVLLVLLNLSLKVYTIALPSSHYQLPHTLHNCKCNLFFKGCVFKGLLVGRLAKLSIFVKEQTEDLQRPWRQETCVLCCS